MKKIKEKPTLSERIKEKAVSTPRELLRKGLDDGSERLRTQLRDTAQHGQADENGGDTIEDTAGGILRPPPACVRTPASPARGRRAGRLPMPQSKSLLLSREKIPLLPGRSRRM